MRSIWFEALETEGILLTTDRRKSLGLAVLGTAISVTGLVTLLLGGPYSPAVGTGGLAAFGIGALLAILALAQLPRPWQMLGIDGQGLHFQFVGLVRWSDISAMRIRRPWGQKVLSIVPRDPDILLRRPPQTKPQTHLAWMTVGPTADDLSAWEMLLPVTLDELLALMRRYHPIDRFFPPRPDARV